MQIRFILGFEKVIYWFGYSIPNKSSTVIEQNDTMNHNLPLLNDVQLRIYNIVIGAVYDSNVYSNVFFIDGPGGTGKILL